MCILTKTDSDWKCFEVIEPVSLQLHSLLNHRKSLCPITDHLLENNLNITLFLFILDFGLARNTKENELLQSFCGTYDYCAPEILRQEPYSGFAADVWSMGIVLYSMLTSTRLSEHYAIMMARGYAPSDLISFPTHISSSK